MDDVRWFAPNRYCTLPVGPLRTRGFTIATDGDKPARLALSADGSCTVAAYHFSIRHRIPLVVYLWDLPPWWLGTGKPDWIFEAFGKIRRIPRPLGGHPVRPGYLSRLRYIAHRARAVWVPSRATLGAVQDNFQILAEHVPFCYDSDRFDTEIQLADPTGIPTLLAISRLVPYKNHPLLVRAAARLDRPVRVRLIGNGPEAAPLRQLAATLGVDLELTEGAGDEVVDQAYRDAAVVVCPSTFEGLGLTPLEALALGRRVVLSDIPPHREFVGDRGTYFAPDDEAALVRAIKAALRLPPPAPSPTPVLTIEACADRLASRLPALLA